MKLVLYNNKSGVKKEFEIDENGYSIVIEDKVRNSLEISVENRPIPYFVFSVYDVLVNHEVTLFKGNIFDRLKDPETLALKKQQEEIKELLAKRRKKVRHLPIEKQRIQDNNNVTEDAALWGPVRHTTTNITTATAVRVLTNDDTT